MTSAIITASGELLYSRLDAVAGKEAVDIEPRGTPLGADFQPSAVKPVAVPGVPMVGVSEDHRAFVEILGGGCIGLLNPFDNLSEIEEPSVQIAEWFNGASFAVFEFPARDMGAPRVLKNFHEINLTIERGSRAYVGIYSEVDGGLRKYSWKGLVHPKEQIRTPINLMGRSIRVRVVAIVFNAASFLVRDMTIGYTVGGSD